MSKATIDLEKDKFNAQGEVKVAGAFEGGRKTDYSSADVTTLSSSTDINKWLGAYNDGVLKKEFVESFDYSSKGTAYYTHPSLGDGNKCLRLFCFYTGTPPNRVLIAKFANVVDWSYDSSLQGVLTLTLGSVTSPGVSSTTGTDVCTVSFTDTGTTGSYSLALSGTNAASYQLNNTTQGQTGSTITNVLKTDTVVIETASNFTGVTYSHSVTCTLTDTNTSRTTSDNISTSGNATAFGNQFYVSDTYRGAATSYTVGNYNRNSQSDKVGFFPDLDSATDFRSSNNVSYSFWAQLSNTSLQFKNLITENYNTSQSDQAFFNIFTYGPHFRLYCAYNGSRRIRQYVNVFTANTWVHIAVTTNTSDVVEGATVYVNGSVVTPSFSDISATIDRSGASVRALCFGGRIPNKDTGSSTYNIGQLPTGSFRLDEFSTWKKTLTASEVTEIYNSGSPTDLTQHSAATDLQRWFRFGDTTGDGTAIKDSQDTSVELTSYDSQNNVLQLGINDSPMYVSDSGNHKYISDTWRGFITGTILVGNYYRDSSTDKKGFFPDLDSTTGFRSSNNVSYSFWAKFNNISNLAALWQEHYVLSATYQSYTSTYINGSNFFVFAAHNASRRNRYCTVPTDNNWHHVVVTTTTADIVSGAIFYIDGAAVSTTLNSYGGGDLSSTRTQPVDAINFGGTLYTRGSSSGTYSNSGSGTLVMDEFSTWKKTLTASEVTELYNNGSPSDLTQHSAATDLQRWFRFGDTTGDGTAIKDSQETSVELTSFDSQNNIQNH